MVNCPSLPTVRHLYTSYIKSIQSSLGSFSLDCTYTECTCIERKRKEMIPYSYSLILLMKKINLPYRNDMYNKEASVCLILM